MVFFLSLSVFIPKGLTLYSKNNLTVDYIVKLKLVTSLWGIIVFIILTFLHNKMIIMLVYRLHYTI